MLSPDSIPDPDDLAALDDLEVRVARIEASIIRVRRLTVLNITVIGAGLLVLASILWTVIAQREQRRADVNHAVCLALSYFPASPGGHVAAVRKAFDCPPGPTTLLTPPPTPATPATPATPTPKTQTRTRTVSPSIAIRP